MRTNIYMRISLLLLLVCTLVPVYADNGPKDILGVVGTAPGGFTTGTKISLSVNQNVLVKDTEENIVFTVTVAGGIKPDSTGIVSLYLIDGTKEIPLKEIPILAGNLSATCGNIEPANHSIGTGIDYVQNIEGVQRFGIHYKIGDEMKKGYDANDETKDNIAITVVSVKLDELTFTGNQTLCQTTDGKFNSNGTEITGCQWKAATPGNPEISQPLLYVWDTSPGITAKFLISPDIGTSTRTLGVAITATKPGQSFSYQKDITLSGTSVTDTFTTTTKIDKQVRNVELSCDIKMYPPSNAEYKVPLASTSNTMYVVQGTPTPIYDQNNHESTNNHLTTKRVEWAINAANGAWNKEIAAAKVANEISLNPGYTDLMECIVPGPNNVLESTRGGDDVIYGNNILGGNNGKIDSTLGGDDKLSAVQAITAGPDGTLQSIRAGTDTQFGTIILPGPTGVLVTTRSGDDKIWVNRKWIGDNTTANGGPWNWNVWAFLDDVATNGYAADCISLSHISIVALNTIGVPAATHKAFSTHDGKPSRYSIDWGVITDTTSNAIDPHNFTDENGNYWKCYAIFPGNYFEAFFTIEEPAGIQQAFTVFPYQSSGTKGFSDQKYMYYNVLRSVTTQGCWATNGKQTVDGKEYKPDETLEYIVPSWYLPDNMYSDCISAGADGQIDSTLAGDDTIYSYISAGQNGVLETIPAGDDYIVGNTIVAGPDGILQSTPPLPPDSDDKIVSKINVGPNGYCQSAAAENDVQIIPINQYKP